MQEVLAGMSGGVDSAAAALLLREAGYHVTGCTLRLCPGGDSSAVEESEALARFLGIGFCAPSYMELFRREVMDYFAAGYAAGQTPNPCIRCNRYVKFAALLHQADARSIEYIATGHYARTAYNRALNRWQLLRGTDRQKDQSYVLYPLTQSQLSRLLLPLGEYDKASIRAIAQAHGVPNAQKKDSQDICFLPEGDYAGFVVRYRGTDFPPGDFIDGKGHVLGRHKGIIRYTTGQRRGLGLGGGRVLYVLGKDMAANTVILGEEAGLYRRIVWTGDFNWVSLPPVREPLPVTAKTRYSQQEAEAVLYPEINGRVRVEFSTPQRAVTEGQSLVAYQGDLVVGGGTICGAE